MKQLSLFQDCLPDINEKKLHAKKWQLFIDGAAKKNPGIAGAGICLKYDDEIIEKKGYFLGHKTNNQAEYFGLLAGLYLVQKRVPIDDVIYIFADSELLVKQMRGEYRVKDTELKKMYEYAWVLLANRKYSFCHIRRELNELADEAANDGIETKSPLPHDLILMLKNHAITV